MIWNFGDPISDDPSLEELEAIDAGLERELDRLKPFLGFGVRRALSSLVPLPPMRLKEYRSAGFPVDVTSAVFRKHAAIAAERVSIDLERRMLPRYVNAGDDRIRLRHSKGF